MSFILPSLICELEADQCFQEYLSMLNEASPRRNRIIQPEPNHEDIIRAIENRNYVGIYYNEEDDPNDDIVKRGFRLIEPYVYGEGYVYRGKTIHPDRKYLRAFVIKDTDSDNSVNWKNIGRRKSVSKTKRYPYWRLFRIDRIKDWMPFKRVNSNYRELYNEDDKLISDIFISASKNSFPKGEIAVRKK